MGFYGIIVPHTLSVILIKKRYFINYPVCVLGKHLLVKRDIVSGILNSFLYVYPTSRKAFEFIFLFVSFGMHRKREDR